MRAIGKLTALAVERAKKRGMYGDGLGLYLQVAEGGSRSWVLRYKRDGRSHYFGLGPLHTVGLAKARERAAEARLQLLENKDPIEARTASRAARSNAMTFDVCAANYIAAHRPGWRSAVHAAQWEQTIATFASPIIGAMDVRAIGVEHVMRVLGDLWKEKPETASRLRGRIESILGWAKVRGYRSGENPATWKGNLQSLLPASRKVKTAARHPAMSYAEIGGFMTELRKQEGVGARALEFAMLTATRTGETRCCAWSEIERDQKLWTIPASRTKALLQHRVPLSDRALAILAEMSAIRDGSDFVFPGRLRLRPLGKGALENALRQVRNDVVVHGFRASFSTWCAEQTNVPSELREMALGHVVGSAVERAYQRSDMFERRRALMQQWADYCGGQAGGNVVAFGSRDHG